MPRAARAPKTAQTPPALPLLELPADLDLYRSLVAALSEQRPVDEGASQVVDEALAACARPGFEAFVSIPRLRFEPLPHQLNAARTSLTRMRGRVILADEVGLGKTIEAGLILSELYLRRLVRNTLIVTPAGLVDQWAEELDQKFALPVLVAGSQAWNRRARPWDAPIVLGSLATLRRDPWRSSLLARSWDLAIFDEAHRLKNAHSASARLAKQLRAVRLLLLTATPVENGIDDLFALVSFVRPGHLGSLKEFRRRHAGASRPAEIDLLQRRMRDVMIRHRRSEIALMLPRRLAETVRVLPGDCEETLYVRISERVRAAGRDASSATLLALRSVQRLAGSSLIGLPQALQRLGWHDLSDLAAQLPASNEKCRVLIERIARHAAGSEKVVVFTAFRQTLAYLAERLAAAGISSACYHGGLSRSEKKAVMHSFAQETPVLLTTQAAGEGRNLQFCHVMINFDLPWNPMQIEQRLGRIHRIGQTHDVLLTNLVNRGTIEDRILSVLEAKINLFELVVGELDMILGRVEDDYDFETSVFAAHIASRDEQEFAARIATLGDRLATARTAYLETRTLNDDLMPAAASA